LEVKEAVGSFFVIPGLLTIQLGSVCGGGARRARPKIDLLEAFATAK
jgi:hypothetical protein